MNQARKRTGTKKVLSMILVLVMLLSLLSMAAFTLPTAASSDSAASNDDFMRIFHLDCGRKYFSVSEIKGIIDQLAANHYTHLQLAFGNNGFRFLLNDMSVGSYTSDNVKSALTNGNNTYSNSKGADSSILSESDMDKIIEYATTKGISIIPMLNTPGHMDALVSAMSELKVGNSRTSSEMSLTDGAQVSFIKALQQKYINYFAEKGSKYYNLAADEYTFSALSDSEYTAFATYVNAIAEMVKDAGMTPICYNDGINYSGKTTSVPFATDILVCYWAQAANYASVTELSNAGFKIINNNDAWYYVLGDYLYDIWKDAQWGYNDAMAGIKNTPVTQAKNVADKAVPVVGSVLCVWCDGPAKTYSTYKTQVYNLIKAMADANPTYFNDAVKLPATDTDDQVSVVVTGKKGQTATVDAVSVTSAYQFDAENVENVVSYNVTPRVAGQEYTAQGTVTLPVPAGWVQDASRIRAYIIDNGAVKLLSGTLADRKYTFDVPHFSEMGLLQIAENGGSTVSVSVNQGSTSSSYTLSGDNLPNDGTYTTTDGLASYTVTTGTGETVAEKAGTIVSGNTYIIGNGTQYVKLDGTSITSTTNPAEATQWTLTANDGGYYITSGNYYLSYYSYGSVIVSTSSYYHTVWKWDTSTNAFNNDYRRNTYYLTYDNGWKASTSKRGVSSQAYTTRALPGEKTVTFTGVQTGTTAVTLGTVRYTIIVNREDLTSATTLPIQLWITNAPIEVTGVTTKGSGQFNDYNNGGYAQYVTVKADAANNCEEGVPLSDIVPVAIKDNATTTKDDRNATNALWKGTVLNTTTGLQKVWWKDMTMADGRTDYQYVRYYGGAWAVSADRVNWKTVTGEGSTGSSSSCKEQIIAYYMQRTDVTKEVITDVVDWGNTTDKWAANTPTQYSVLDFAVKYPDGTQVPNTFPENGKTVYFHCSESDTTGVVYKDNNNNYYRRIGLINGIDTTGYEIYMITVTPTSDSATDQLTDKNTGLTTSTKIEYNGTEKVAWVDDESNLPAQFQSDDAKFTSISGTYNYTSGGNPNIAGLEIYQRQGMLVTYYIRPIVTADSLHVYYVDDTTQEQFYNYAINVNSLYSGDMKFDEGIALNQPAWKGPLKNGTVKNDYNVTQTVSADLSTMPAIDAKYRYAVDYTCVRVERSADGKSVTLYYTFKADKTFVVDFGLPLVIQPTDISANLGSATLTSVTAKSSTKTDYAEIITNSENCNITYKLKTMLNGADKLDVKYDGTIPTDDGTQTGSVSYEVGIIPASTVYYEDNFVAFSGNWQREGDTTTNAVQDLDALTAQKTYGYDSHYGASSKFSLGSAMKTTVSSATNSNPPTATFTFKGTGFDLVSMTSKDTGTILVNVNGTTENNETVTKHWIVDTFYGYTRTQQGYIEYTWTKGSDGTWHNKAIVIPDLPEGVTIGGTPKNNGDKTYEPNYIWTRTDVDDNALYQIPVIHYTDLPYGTYTVTVTPKYSSSRDPYYQAGGNNNSYDFYLDGVRIYNPAGDKLNSQYVKDGEGYAKFTEIRNMLLNASGLTANIQSTTGMVFVDGVGNGQLADYTNYGPNNEVYLTKNQAIAFKISDMSNVDSIQIGAKAPDGAAIMQIQVGGNGVQTQELNTASDMYYKLDNVQANQTIVITNTGDNLLSLTTLKVTYKTDPSASNSADPVVDEEVVAQAPVMLMSMLYGEPETFEPEYFSAKWSRNVRKGGTATLTVKASADVEAITVNGEKITVYTTKTARSFWGSKETYHVFTYRVTNAATADYSVCALNADSVASDPITAPLTVRPSIRDWWNGIFNKWKH